MSYHYCSVLLDYFYTYYVIRNQHTHHHIIHHNNSLHVDGREQTLSSRDLRLGGFSGVAKVLFGPARRAWKDVAPDQEV